VEGLGYGIAGGENQMGGGKKKNKGVGHMELV